GGQAQCCQACGQTGGNHQAAQLGQASGGAGLNCVRPTEAGGRPTEAGGRQTEAGGCQAKAAGGRQAETASGWWEDMGARAQGWSLAPDARAAGPSTAQALAGHGRDVAELVVIDEGVRRYCLAIRAVIVIGVIPA